jgi:hypothetical protein
VEPCGSERVNLLNFRPLAPKIVSKQAHLSCLESCCLLLARKLTNTMLPEEEKKGEGDNGDNGDDDEGLSF